MVASVRPLPSSRDLHSPAARRERDERVLQLLERARTTTDPDERRRLENRVVEEHRHVCRSVAVRFSRRGDVDDLTQVASVGLVKAARRWQPGHCDAFLQYALPTMTGEILRYLRDHTSSIRIPRRMQELRAELHQPEHAAATLTETVSAVAERTGAPEDLVREAAAVADFSSPISLDTTVAADDGPGAPSIGMFEPGFTAVETFQLLADFLPTLTPQERTAVRLRVGPELSQSQIAQQMGVSQMQVCRLLARVAKKAHRFCATGDAFAA